GRRAVWMGDLLVAVVRQGVATVFENSRTTVRETDRNGTQQRQAKPFTVTGLSLNMASSPTAPPSGTASASGGLLTELEHRPRQCSSRRPYWGPNQRRVCAGGSQGRSAF